MNKKVLLAYIDLLGFSSYVEKNNSAIYFKKQLEGIFKSVTEQHAKLAKEKLDDDDPINSYLMMFNGDIEFMMYSDSLIIWLDMERAVQQWIDVLDTIEGAKVTDQYYEAVTDHIYRYFLQNISLIVFLLICETRLLVRGGIALGDFYNSQFEHIKGEFLYSQVLIDAYNLEKHARMPRIIISDEICSKLKESVRMDHSLIWTDTDGENVLNVYNFPRYWNGYTKILEGLFRGHMYTSNKESFHSYIGKKLKELSPEKNKHRDIWNKWYWFKEYHNRQMQDIDESFVVKE